MREITIHCSARDQEVRVLVTDDPAYDAQASILDSHLLCLEIGLPDRSVPLDVEDTHRLRAGSRQRLADRFGGFVAVAAARRGDQQPEFRVWHDPR